jgi:hypothetical protein
MGCTDCAQKGGCSTRKGEEAQLLGELLGRLYPGARWGQPDDTARFRGGLPERAARRLARAASAALRAPSWFELGGHGDSCDWIYLLCVGRKPALYELSRAVGPITSPDGDSIREVYLRVALSSMARVAAVQEVVFELRRTPDGADYELAERPRDGVYDPILLPRTRKLIDLLVGAELTYIDFGLLVKPARRFAEGWEDGEYEARYGQPPGTVNWLFYPQPATAVTTSFVPARAA